MNRELNFKARNFNLHEQDRNERTYAIGDDVKQKFGTEDKIDYSTFNKCYTNSYKC